MTQILVGLVVLGVVTGIVSAGTWLFNRYPKVVNTIVCGFLVLVIANLIGSVVLGAAQ